MEEWKEYKLGDLNVQNSKKQRCLGTFWQAEITRFNIKYIKRDEEINSYYHYDHCRH